MNPDAPTPPPEKHEDALRPHTYDGIQEFDKKLPNWWLMTFYGAIAFSVGYYACYEWWRALPDQVSEVKTEMARIEAIKLASVASLSDDNLWQMSQNATFVDAGRALFAANCASCHKADLTGGIGPNLVDGVWIHGGAPMNLYKTVTEGVAAKGMPAWGPLLGTKKVTEVVSFVLSHHKKPQ